MAWIKRGSMMARRGKLKFTRQSAFEQGFGKVLKKVFTREGAFAPRRFTPRPTCGGLTSRVYLFRLERARRHNFRQVRG